MKKWMYLIFPGAMLGLFLVFYLSHQKDTEQKEHDRKVAVAQKKATEDAAKAESERVAKEQALKTQKEREEADRKKAEERRAKQVKADNDLRDQLNKSIADAAALQKEAVTLEADLKRIYEARDRASREAFEMLKQVELGKVARRTAEIETARLIEMLAQRADRSAMASPPPPPPPPTPAR